MPIRLFAVLAALVFLGLPAHALAGSSERGRQLAALRSEVNDLEAKVDRLRSEFLSEQQSLQNQKAELEIMHRKEQVRRDTLQRLRSRQITERRKTESWSARLVEPAKEAVEQLRGLVLNTLPFKRKERLAALGEIESGLRAAKPDSALAISRLWQFLEDELKLTAESGLHRQVVLLNGQRRLIEVARIGMALLFFRTKDDRYGWAERSPDGGYRFVVFDDSVRTEATKALFEALRKQIRQGLFLLPLPHPPAWKQSNAL